MNTIRNAGLLALLSAALAAGPALAEKPDWAGGKSGDKQERKADGKEAKQDRKDDRKEAKQDRKDDRKEAKQDRKDDKRAAKARDDVKVGAYFNDDHRSRVRTYYTQQYSTARSCPPGLAKKNNGCLPPGQAKKYAVGKPLPRDVVYYTVPPQAVLYLPPVPVGYRYVRVSADILLIAIGTSMVVDAVTDLMR